MNYLVLLLTICTVLSVKKPPDLDPPNSSTTARSTTTTIKSTSKNPTTTPTKSTSKSPPSTTTKSTTKKPPTTSTWDPPTTTVIYDEPGDCDFETECQWRLSTTDIYLGCYDDHGRLLPNQAFSNSSNSKELCLAECKSRGFFLAGLQFGAECWCGSEGPPVCAQVGQEECATPCPGNAQEMCGGSFRMEIYLVARDWRQVMAGEVTHPPHADHTTNMREGNFIDLTANNIGPKTGTTYQGCYRDNQTRILDVKKYQSDDNTLEKCETACREDNYKLFGVESGVQCFCGNSCPSEDLLAEESECNQHCSGDQDQTCGGGWRLNIFGIHYNNPAVRDNQFNSSRSVLISSGPLTGQHCFSFWHFMYGSKVEFLNVYVRSGDQQELYFSKYGTQGLRWIESKFNVDGEVTIEGTIDSNFGGSVTLDDLRLVTGQCHEDQDHPWDLCTFELTDNSCGYSNREGRDLSWGVRTGDQDHTFNTERGHYMALDITTDTNHQTGRLESPYYALFGEDSEQYCVSFYWKADVRSPNLGGTHLNVLYHLQGDEQDHQASSVKLYNTIPYGTWKLGEAEIVKAQSDFSVVFELQAGKANATVGLDDVKILPGKCSTNNCDFTYDFCFWTNLKDDEADWVRVVRDDGIYLLIDDGAVTDTSKMFTAARLQSQVIPPFQPPAFEGLCVKFRYRIIERETLSLVVGSSGHERTVWEVSGDSGGEWLDGSVPIPDQALDFQIILQASLRSGVKGSVSVDDVILDFTTTCSLQPETADPANSAPDHISCSFDNGYCEYSSWQMQGLLDDGQLEIVSGRPTEANSGPESGVENSFLFLDSLKYGRSFWLLNSSFAAPSPNDYCLSFYYHNFGYSESFFSVAMETMNAFNVGSLEEDIQDIFLVFNSSQVDEWHEKSLTIKSRQYNWRLIFKLLVSGPYGDFSLDQLELRKGACKISHDCQFELGNICNWNNVTDTSDGDVYWRLMTGNEGFESNNTNFPFTDHSTTSPSGHFLVAHVTEDIKPESKARIISREFGKNFGTQCLSLWSTYRGDSDMVLTVFNYKEKTNTSKVMTVIDGFHNEYDWGYHQVEITENEKFQILLQAEVFVAEGKVKDSVFSIDDLQLEPSPCPALTSCSFDSGLCSYQSSASSPLVWLVGRGRTSHPDTITGPQYAVSGQSYAYTDFTQENISSEDTAQLSSHYMGPTDLACVSLWYNMFGQHPGRLRVVKIVNIDGDQSDLLVKTVPAGSPPHWYPARVEYSHLHISTYRIALLATYGGGPDGMIAVDDVIIKSGGCDEPPTPRPDPPPAIPEVSCSFEETCPWTMTSTGPTGQWNIGEAQTVEDGPSYDHTVQNGAGHYAYVSSDHHDQTKIYRMSVKPPASIEDICFTFWYHMQGGNFKRLSLTSVIGSADVDNLGRKYQIRSWNYPDSYAGTSEGTDQLSVIKDDGEEEFFDRTEFIIREGLCGDSEYISLESAQRPNMFWRHQNLILKLHEKTNEDIFKQDSCFRMIKDECSGITGTHSVTFESRNFQDYYISKCDNQIKIDQNYCGGDINNGCWELSANLVQIFFSTSSRAVTASEKNENVGLRLDDQSYGMFQLSRFRQVGGLAEQSEKTASFELGSRPGEFLYTKTESLYNYRGCYRDNQTRVMDVEMFPGDGQNSLEKCQELCRKETYKLFGVESGAQCYCGNTDPNEELKLEESQCQDPCSGDQNEICGGYWAINIYDINYDLTPLDVKVGPRGQGDAQPFTWILHGEGEEDGLSCSGNSVSISSFQFPQYFIAKCKNDLVIVNKPTWADQTVCNETNFDLFHSGCWSIETASNIYYLDLFSTEGSRGDDWRENIVQYRPDNENYELVFTAETGNNEPESWGDIALDDIYVYYGECLSEAVCTFDSSDICGFSQDETDTDDWTVGSFFDDNSGSSPPFDHSSQGQLSRSVYFQNYPSNSSLFSASLFTPQYPPFEAGCMTFWYYMWSDQEDQNMTLTVSSSSGDPWWFRFGRMKASWEKASIDLVTEDTAQFVFKVEGKNEPGHVKTVAFDDYSVDRSDFCFDVEMITCDFETKDFCNWKNLEDDALDWVLATSDTESGELGPDTDHTTGTGLGHYLYIRQDQSVRGETAKLESNIAIAYPYTSACFSFWSYMYGNNNGRLTVLKVSTITQVAEVVFDRVESLDKEWKFHQIELQNGETANFYYLQIVVFSENSQNGGIIAVDDLQYEMESCPNPPPDTFKCSEEQEIPIYKKCDFVMDCSNGLDELECGDCDFEGGLCGWFTPYLQSKFSWSRTQFNGTGPTVDHTVGDQTGWYVLAHQENSDQFLDETFLMSPPLMQTFSSCKLTFWMFLQSENKTTSLEVSGQTGTEPRTIYYKDSQKHSEWTYVEAHLDRQHSPFVIIFIGYPELGGDSQIALDDIQYKDCNFPSAATNCSGSEVRCANKVCVAASDLCDNTDNCGDLSDEADCADHQLCTFESGLCGWENIKDSGSDFSWVLTTFQERPGGPTRDHSLNTRYGTFLSVDQTTPSDLGQQVRLASSVLSTEGGCQVTFYVYSAKYCKTVLRVKTREAVGGPETVIFNQTETRDFDYWIKKTASVDTSLAAFQIIFEVETQTSSKSRIFLDDIILSPECKTEDIPLPTVTTPPTTTSDPCYFRCGDKCLEPEKVCNFHPDCPDSEDELHCAECDFESDFCGWDATSGSDSSGWLRWRGEDDLANSVTPSGDHNDKYDAYFLLALISGAELFSPVIGGSGEACQMNFWYSSFNASHELKMQVLQNEEVIKEEIFAGHDESWTSVVIDLDIEGSYQLYFVVTYPSGLDINLIAIDDFTFSGCDALNPPPPEISCDFESSLCGWVQETSGDEADWTRTNTGTWYENTGPGYDHTTGTGYYVYFSSNGHQAGDRASLITPTLTYTGDKTACVSFWYHLYGEDLDTVNLNIIMDQINVTLWTKFSTQGNIWKKAQVDIPKSFLTIQFEFEAIASVADNGHIALDDILYQEDTECQDTHHDNCDFQNGFCRWTNQQPEIGSWIVTSNEQSGAGPSGDHTYGTYYGKFIQARGDGQNGDEFGTAVLESEQLKQVNTEGDCLLFWYYLHEKNSSDGTQILVNMYQEGQEERIELKKLSGDHGEVWRLDRTPLKSDVKYKIQIVGEVWSEEDLVCLDDLKVEYEPCSQPLACTFESGDTCSWSNSREGEGVWLLTSGSTPSADTGPSYDHTVGDGTGHYLYTEASLMLSDQFTLLESEPFLFTEDMCFSLWYHMYGEDVGSLLISTLDLATQDSSNLTEVSGDHGDSWTEMLIDTTTTKNKLTLLQIRGFVSDEALYGDIAIDDVLIRSGPCFEETTTEATTTTTTSYVVEESPLDCDFETEGCKWMTEEGSSGEWQVSTGQSADHTTGSTKGSFISLTSSCQSGSCQTGLKSQIPVMVSAEESLQCLQFWYKIESPLWSSLAVTARSVSSTSLWRRAGTTGSDWTSGRIQLSSENLPENTEYYLIFQAEYGPHVMTSLDDITLTEGECPPVSDGCDFESVSQCGWHQETEEGERWERVRDSDHTYQTELGHSMMLSHGSTDKQVTHLLVSPIIAGHDEAKCLNFYYLMTCTEAGAKVNLNVYRRSPGQDISDLSPVFHVSECIEDQWMAGVATLPVSEQDSEVVVEGSVFNSSVYFDDFSVGGPHCGTDYDHNRCSFESATLCGWSNLVPVSQTGDGDTEDFLVTKGQDHTSGENYGHYATVTFPGQATLVSQPAPTGQACLTLFSIMSSQDTVKITARVQNSLTELVTWHGSQISHWERHKLNINFNDTAHLYLEATVVNTPVSVDDIKIEKGKCEDETDKFDCGDGQLIDINLVCNMKEDCSNGQDESQCGDCSFESDMCGWENRGQTDYDWVRHNCEEECEEVECSGLGNPGTSNITKYFAYLRHSDQDHTDRAVLHSPTINGVHSTCQFKYWFVMRGKDAVIDTFVNYQDSDLVLLSHNTEDTANNWTEATVYVGKRTGQLSLELQSRPETPETLIAVDDLRLVECAPPSPGGDCEEGEFQCSSQVCLDQNVVCDATDDCGDSSDEADCGAYPPICSFEEDCDWYNKGWTLQSGPTPGHNTGPNFDHTTGQTAGHFMYHGGSTDQVYAKLTSLVLSQGEDSSCQLRFYYYMYGTNVGKLTIGTTQYGGNGTENPVMSVTGNKGQLWNRGSAPVHPADAGGLFQFFIRAKTSEAGLSDGEADIAIDDLSLSQGCSVEGDTSTAASTTTTPPTTTTSRPCSQDNQFWCQDQADTCLDLSKVCDFTSDCPNGLDEESCGSCSFEGGLLDPSCGYQDSSTGTFQWSNVQAGSPGPVLDHSTGTEEGHYMMVLHSDNLYGEEAVLTSPAISATKNMCTLRFWYHVQAQTKTVFSVSLTDSNDKTKVIFSAEHSDPMETWTSGAGLVGAKAGSSLEFRSSPADCGTDTCNITVALDDISLDHCKDTAGIIDCNFNNYDNSGEANDETFCNWSQVDEDDLDWVLVVDPEEDDKGYIQLQTQAAETQTGWLESLVVPPDQTYCFKFKYKLYGDTVGSLKIVLRPNDTTVLEPEVVWQRLGSQDNDWVKGQVQFKPTFPVSLMVRGETRGRFSPLSVDSLDISVNNCPSTPACGFEKGFCSWKNKGDMNWKRGSGLELFGQSYSPDHDHTSKSEFGTFLYLDPRNNEGKTAVLRGTKPAYNDTKCLTLWYTSSYGNRVKVLQQFVNGSGDIVETKRVWTKPGYDLGSWQFVRVQLRMNSRKVKGYKVDITGEIGDHGDKAVTALDDIEIFSGDCPATDQCDFEEDDCGYGNFISDQFDWIRFSPAEDSVFVGPAVDMSLDTTDGHSFIAPVGGHKPNDSATFITPLISRDSKCLTFWYNFWNSSQLIELRVKHYTGGVDDQEVMRITEGKQHEWIRQTISLPDDGWSDWFALSFEAKMIADTSQEELQHGSLAVDDITFIEDCSTTTTTSTTTVTTTVTSTSTTTTLPSVIDCDFESSSTCEWEQVEEDQLDWEFGSGRTPHNGTGPVSDHTTEGEGGVYLYLSSVRAEEKQVASLLSPILRQYEEGACLEFWYSMYGLEVMSLSLVSEEDQTSLWESDGSQGLYWKRAAVHLMNINRVILSGTTGRGTRGDIAIDDIFFSQGQCPSDPLAADFESGDGGYVNQDADTGDWMLEAAVGAVEGPSRDHSLNSLTGHYFVSNCTAGSGGTFGRLASVKYSGSVTCLRYWYNIKGTVVLNVNVKYKSMERELRQKVGNIDTNGWWVVDEVSLSGNDVEFQLIFEFVCGDEDYSGYVALDDVFVTDQCSSLNCNFEEDCLWANSPTEEVSWIIGMPELDQYGPDVDHTINTAAGKFLYLENGLDNQEPLSAVFLSSPITDPNICLSFWFWRGGNDKDSLSVDLFYTDTYHVLNSLWTSSNMEELWSWQIVSLSVDTSLRNITGDYRLGYLGEILPNSSPPPDVASVAIDDIIVKTGECAEPLITTPTPDPCVHHCDGTCVLPTQVCDYRLDCQDGWDEADCPYECDFETDSCDWLADSDSPWVWSVERGQGHDNTEGEYLSVGYSDSPGTDSFAGFTSPWLFKSYHSCKLTFWYLIKSTEKPEELLKVHLIDHNGEDTDITQLARFTTDTWTQHTSAVGRMGDKVKIMFLGRLLSDTDSVSIDEVKMTECGMPPTSTECEVTTSFSCMTGVCVSEELLCDLTDDCGDGGDETVAEASCDQYIASCDFETGSTCSWTLPGGPAQWEIVTGSVRDHTTNLISGHFLSASNTASAVLLSPVVYHQAGTTSPTGGTNLPCQLRIHFLTNVHRDGVISVYKRRFSDQEPSLVWSLQGESNLWWERHDINITETDHVQFSIEANAPATSSGDIVAIDDLSFSYSCSLYGDSLPPGPTSTSPPSTTASCPDQAWHCPHPSQCIPADRVCDFSPDCQDGSDEAECAQCDFESGTCGWSDVSQGRYGWQRAQREDGEGFMMEVVKSDGEMSDDALLLTTGLGSVSSQCQVSFKYFKSGGAQGGAILWLTVEDGTSEESEVIWSEENDLGTTWYTQTVGIGAREAGWRLGVTGRIVEEYLSWTIKIDDMMFSNCSSPEPQECHEGQWQCHNGACVDSQQKCDFSNDCGDWSDEEEQLCSAYPASCDFEDGLCGNVQDSSDDLDWILRTGFLEGDGPGPGEDHTTGNSTGHFLYIPPTEDIGDTIARIHGPSFLPASPEDDCYLRFWYHLHASDVTQLRVYQFNEETQEESVWITIDKEEEYAWKERREQITVSENDWHLIFEARRSMGPEGDLSLDDISYSVGCKPSNSSSSTPSSSTSSTTSSLCSEDEFTCRNGDCIPMVEVCDFKSQCGDESDEEFCRSNCNFDSGSCLWVNRGEDGLDWILASSNNSLDGTDLHGPYNRSGSFLFLQPDKDMTDFSDKTAVVSSPHYQNSAAGCIMKAWLYISGNMGNTLDLKVNTNGLNITLDKVSLERVEEGVWTLFETDIGRREKQFQMIFDKEPSAEYEAGVAVDDVEFTDCAIGNAESNCDSSEFFHCQSSQVCIPRYKVCDLSDDCGDGSDEDQSWCKEAGYLQYSLEDGAASITEMFSYDPTTDQEWEVGRGEEEEESNPLFDHTTHSPAGHYLYVPIRVSSEGYSAGLLSVPLTNNGSCRPSVFYHLYGGHVGTLSVWARYQDGTLVGEKIERNLNGLNVWRPLVLDTVSLALQPFQIVVSAVIKTETLTGDLALDDWSFPPGCALYTGDWNSTTSTSPVTASSTPSTITASSSTSTISADTGSESHSHTSLIISLIVIILTVVLAGIAFGYLRIRKSVRSVSASNRNVTNILNSINSLIASNEERDRATVNVQEFQMDDIGTTESGTSK